MIHMSVNVVEFATQRYKLLHVESNCVSVQDKAANSISNDEEWNDEDEATDDEQ